MARIPRRRRFAGLFATLLLGSLLLPSGVALADLHPRLRHQLGRLRARHDVAGDGHGR